jgi:hypothetical protein
MRAEIGLILAGRDRSCQIPVDDKAGLRSSARARQRRVYFESETFVPVAAYVK